jgi:hypothetical protein
MKSARHALIALDAFADADAGALGDDRLELGRLGRGFEEDLATDREAEASDAVGIDVGAATEVLDSAEEVAIARPPDGVAFAPALSARVQQQDALPCRMSIRASSERVAPGKRITAAWFFEGTYDAVSFSELLVVT